ncbi:MAG: hypothetical protein JO254_14040 [Pseudolabrys sp.]|nr:hypothetical protein [Pseudolabrys sp.]
MRYLILATLLALAFIAPAIAQTAMIGKIAIDYGPAGTDAEAIQGQLKQRKTLERIARLLSPLRLPRVLTLRMRDCKSDGSYDSDVITVCYEPIKRFSAQSNEASPPQGVTHDGLLVGATLDLFLHETGHALFDMLELPVFGREEDAADQFSAYTMLQFPRDEARQLILGVALILSKEDEDDQQKPFNRFNRYGGEHSLPAQRYYNYLCLAYGFDPQLFATEGALLPSWRAKNCSEEYAQVKRAYEQLVLPHINDESLARLRQQSALLGAE